MGGGRFGKLNTLAVFARSSQLMLMVRGFPFPNVPWRFTPAGIADVSMPMAACLRAGMYDPNHSDLPNMDTMPSGQGMYMSSGPRPGTASQITGVGTSGRPGTAGGVSTSRLGARRGGIWDQDDDDSVLMGSVMQTSGLAGQGAADPYAATVQSRRGFGAAGQQQQQQPGQYGGPYGRPGSAGGPSGATGRMGDSVLMGSVVGGAWSTFSGAARGALSAINSGRAEQPGVCELSYESA